MTEAPHEARSKWSWLYWLGGAIALPVIGWTLVQYASNFSTCYDQIESANRRISSNLYESVSRRQNILAFAKLILQDDAEYRSRRSDHSDWYQATKEDILAELDPHTNFYSKDFEGVDLPELARNVDYEVLHWNAASRANWTGTPDYGAFIYSSVSLKDWLQRHRREDGFVLMGSFRTLLASLSNTNSVTNVSLDTNSDRYQRQTFIHLLQVSDEAGLVSEQVCFRKAARPLLGLLDFW